MNKKVWIKANGNGIIATGHIRRCMTIAKELMDNGAEVVFVLSDIDSADLLRTLSDEDGTTFDSVILHNNFSEPMEDLPLLKELFASEKPDFYLMDSYFLKEDYFQGINDLIKELALQTKTGFIDDLYKFDYPVDLIINYDIIIPKDFYSAPKQLLGPEFSPLRPQFADNRYEVRDIARTALLSSGGTDPYHVLGDILKEIYVDNSPCRKVLDTTGLHCDVVVGALFEEGYKEELRELAKEHKEITLHETVGDMASLMKKADFAVSAGGTTLYELCAVGVPTVVFSMADNQVEFVQSFDKAGAAKYAGDARKDRRLVQKIVTLGTAAQDNAGFRKRMSDKAKSLIDGKGAERIAKAILEFI